MFVTGRQIRAARALLGWTRAERVVADGLHQNAVARRDNMAEIPTRKPFACQQIRKALRAAGLQLSTRPRVQGTQVHAWPECLAEFGGEHDGVALLRRNR